MWSKQTAGTDLICFQYGEIQCTHILPPAQDRKMTVSLTFLKPYLSFSSIWIERHRDCALGWEPLLEKHLLWSARPMLDLRGLISLDNKTKRVNVLIVADGAGILGKCVKLVLTSGPHSSPPSCDLLLPSLRCSLHPSHSIPPSSHVLRSSPLVTLSLVSRSTYIHPYRDSHRGTERV